VVAIEFVPSGLEFLWSVSLSQTRIPQNWPLISSDIVKKCSPTPSNNSPRKASSMGLS